MFSSLNTDGIVAGIVSGTVSTAVAVGIAARAFARWYFRPFTEHSQRELNEINRKVTANGGTESDSVATRVLRVEGTLRAIIQEQANTRSVLAELVRRLGYEHQ